MPRTIWTKLLSDPNGSWTRHEGDPPFNIPATGGLDYDVRTDTGESFIITPLATATAPSIVGLPTLVGLAETGRTLVASPAPSTGTAPITTSWQWLRDGVEIPGATAGAFALGSGEAGAAISVRQTDSNAAGSDSATSAPVVVTAASSSGAAIISGLLVTNQSPTGEVTLAYSIDRDSAISGVVTGSAATPSATRILAGQDETGAPAASSFADFWTISGNDTLPDIASGLAPGTYYLHVLPSGGGDGDVVSSNGFQLETEAPEVATAQTSPSGLEIEVQFSETLSGDTTADDWTLSADGADQAIATAIVSGDLVRLGLLAPVATGQTLTLSYTGSGLADPVANPVGPFSSRPVTNAVSGSFAENSVTVPQGSYLTASDPLPGNARTVLFFGSLAQNAGYEARAALATWRGTAGGIHSDYTTGNALGGVRLRFQDGSASINETAEPVPLGTRYHLLVSAWIDNTDVMQTRSWMLDTSIGTWADVVNNSDSSTPGSVFELGPDPLRLFTRSDGSGHPFAGTVSRIAFWAAPQSTPIADIADPSVRSLFAEADGMKDPALSRIALGQPLVDFAGTAADYNAGLHSGSLGAFLPTGTFS